MLLNSFIFSFNLVSDHFSSVLVPLC